MSAIAFPTIWVPRRRPIIVPSAAPPAPQRRPLKRPLELLLDLAFKAGNLLRTSTAPYHLTNGCGASGCPGLTTPSSVTVSGISHVFDACTCEGSPCDDSTGLQYCANYHDSQIVPNTGPDTWFLDLTPSCACVQCQSSGQGFRYTQVQITCHITFWQLDLLYYISGLGVVQSMTWGKSPLGTGPTGSYTYSTPTITACPSVSDLTVS